MGLGVGDRYDWNDDLFNWSQVVLRVDMVVLVGGG